MSETVNHLKNMEKKKSSIEYGKLLQDLLKHKKLFYKVLAITFVVACVYAFSLPSNYKCMVTLSPEMSTTRSSGSLAALATSFGVNLKGGVVTLHIRRGDIPVAERYVPVDRDTSFEAVINYLDSLKIFWAPVFGSYDNASAQGVEWQCKKLEESSYCNSYADSYPYKKQ